MEPESHNNRRQIVLGLLDPLLKHHLNPLRSMMLCAARKQVTFRNYKGLFRNGDYNL
jgi:hypothetical protein